MRKIGFLLTAATAGLLAAGGSAPALATPSAAVKPASPAASAPYILTLITPGGAPAVPGDTVVTMLTPGTALSLTTGPGGGVGLTCLQSAWGGNILSNPTAPGTAVIQLFDPVDVASCTDSSPGVIGVNGIVLKDASGIVLVNDGSGTPIQIEPQSAPLQVVLNLATTAGPVTCTYLAPIPINGNSTLGLSPWKFANQPFRLAGGALPFCGAPTDFFTASYGPVVDTTAGGSNVYIN